jgi:pantoate--beta-alanine ligase
VKVVETRAEFTAARAALPAPVGLVPTMGALHAGHAALVQQARAESASVVATVFVNPMQFGPTEDLARYPRTLAADLQTCEQFGVDLVWVPEVDDIYPGGPAQVSVDPGALGADLEGRFRPTHFAGVLTVVAKFFAIVRPDAAYFGEKDYQQLVLIRRMVLDLDLGVQVVGVPIVREQDGLALSSRNVYLSPAERADALALSQALRAGQQAGAAGHDPVEAARAVLDAVPEVLLDYLELRGTDLGPAPAHGAARLLVAARVGATRLIDNMPINGVPINSVPINSVPIAVPD